ncbi:MAG: hypothetical protein V4619_17595 [Bacteroidota bacterium]
MIKIDDILSALKFACTTCYFLVAAQGANYVVLRFNRSVSLMSPSQFADLRRLTDIAIETPLKVLYLSTVILMALWLLLAYPPKGSSSYLLFVLAFILIVADLVMAIKISIPLNKLILNGNTNPIKYQLDWIKWISIRGYFSVTGMVILLLDRIWR